MWIAGIDCGFDAADVVFVPFDGGGRGAGSSVGSVELGEYSDAPSA